jgi:tetratricopeptide (TPR) repeat protein
MKLNPRDGEARLWLAATYHMSGDAQRGSALFLFDPQIPKDYTSLIYLRMATDYAVSVQTGHYFDRQTQQLVQTQGPARGAFLEAAQAYVERHKPSGPAATQLMSESVDAKLQAGDFRGAEPDLLVLLQNRPNDPRVQKQWTTCLAGLKNQRAARAQATYVLGIDPLWADGYLLRAESAAEMGDSHRAQADLEAARHLDPGKAAARQARLRPLLNANPPPVSAPAEFTKAAESGASWEQLVTSAVQLRRWFEPHRARYDELWQERLWLLAESRRNDPKNPDRAELEARYFLNSISVPRIWDGPRADPVPLRRQSPDDQEREAREIIRLCDEALKLDPRHVPAIATKADVLYKLGSLAAAESLVKEGLAIEPDNVPLLELDAQCRQDESVAVMAPTIGLRAGHTSVRYEHRPDGTYRVETHTGPTASESARANGLVDEATALRQEGMASVVRARSVKAQKIPPLLAQAQRALKKKDGKAAELACRRALRLWPDNPKAQELLAEALGQQGRTADQTIYASFSQPIPFTSAADELRQAWTDIERTAFKTAEGSLDRGAALDPTDARIPACRGVIAEARNNDAQAEHWREAALALEEARVRTEGTSLEGPAKEPLAVQDVGLFLLLSQKSATAQLASDPRRTLEMEQAIAALESRLPKESIYNRLPSGMLPDPNAEPGHLPEAPSVASLFAWAHLRAGQALLALHRPAEARNEFDRVFLYSNLWPIAHEGRETLGEVTGWAWVDQMKLAMAEKRWDDAGKLINVPTSPGGPDSQELAQARRQVSEEYFRKRQQQEQLPDPFNNPNLVNRLSEWEKAKLRRDN